MSSTYPSESTHRAQTLRPGYLRVLALLIGFAVLCFGAVVAGSAPAHAAGTAKLSGKLTVPAGVDLSKVTISTSSVTGSGGSSSFTIDAAGNYVLSNLDAGEYYLNAIEWNGQGGARPYKSQQFLRFGTTNTVTLAAGQAKTQNLTMKPATAKISGTIDLRGKWNESWVAVSEKIGDKYVTLAGNAWNGTGSGVVNYSTFGLVAGTYKVEFRGPIGPNSPRPIWWDGAWSEQTATPITLTTGQAKTGVNGRFLIDYDTRPTGVTTVPSTARVGQKLTATLKGAWTPAPTVLEYRWNPVGSGGPGGPAQVVGQTYTPTAKDVGGKVLLQVSAESPKDRLLDFVETEVTVLPGLLTAPTPTVSGTPKVGQTLQAVPGTWGPAPVALKYQWLRDGAVISGATSTSYTAVAADQGKRLSVKVTGTKAAYTTASKTSAQTTAVAAKDPVQPPFIDVSQGDQFFKEINWMYTSGISTGVQTPAGREYQPKEKVSREAMAAFLYRMSDANYVGPAVSPFSDVQKGDKFYNEIAWMYHEGLSTGVKQPSGKPKYDPKATVSREAMAAFIFRLEPRTYTAPKVSYFADVSPGQPFYRQISWMYDAKISTGTKQPSGKPLYEPKDGVTRGAMAAFLYRIEHQ